MSDEKEIPALHIYPQAHWHTPAWIVGDRIGLQRLADTILRALQADDGKAHDSFFPSDGEGYQVAVVRYDHDWMDHKAWYQLRGDHYTDEVAANGGGELGPDDLYYPEGEKR